MSVDEALIAREIMKGVPKGLPPAAAERVLRSRLRSLGDQIGEPILSDPSEAPAHYVVVELPEGTVPASVATTPRAAERLLGRA